MNQFIPLSSSGNEGRARVSVPAAPWDSAEPEAPRPAARIPECRADRLVLLAESDNRARPVRPDSDPHEIWFAIQSQEAAKRDGHFGLLPKIHDKPESPHLRGRPTMAQDRLMAVICRGPITAAELAEAVGYTKSAASSALFKLEQRGLVRKADKSGAVYTYEATK